MQPPSHVIHLSLLMWQTAIYVILYEIDCYSEEHLEKIQTKTERKAWYLGKGFRVLLRLYDFFAKDC